MIKRSVLMSVVAVLSLPLSNVGAAEKKPNVVFILADDLESSGLNVGGREWLETPNLDLLAKEGRRFETALAPYPTCKPSRAVILSGQYGPRTGVYRVVDRHTGMEDKIKFLVPANGTLRPEVATMASALKANGYRTGMFGKWHVSNERKDPPTKYGFDTAVASTGHYKAKFVPERKLKKGQIAADLLTDEAVKFIGDAKAEGKPFFLYMPYYLVHKPLEARQDYIDHFRKRMGAEASEQQVVLAAMTKMLDDCVGRLVKKLEDEGVRGDTLIVFSSDNGSFEEMYNGKLRGVKGETYEGGMRVPLIFNFKDRIQPGVDVVNRVSGMDLFPTLLEVTGSKRPDQPMDGVSLWPVLSGKSEALAERSLFCYFPKYSRMNKRTGKWKFSWRNVIYRGEMKLIHYPEEGNYELFDLKADPSEKNDVIGDKAEVAEALKAELVKWLKDVGAAEMQRNPDFSDAGQ